MDSSQHPGLTKACAHCESVVSFESIFCPKCGWKFGHPEEEISIFKEVTIYIVGFFFVPAGLYWTFIYKNSTNKVRKRVAVMSSVITIIAAVMSVVLFSRFLAAAKQYSGIQNDADVLENLNIF